MESLKPSQEWHKLLLLQSDGGKETDPCVSRKCVRFGKGLHALRWVLFLHLHGGAPWR